eukprot:COSAG04_NODE_31331_length_257_cov_0.658228_1_plen_48_part_10
MNLYGRNVTWLPSDVTGQQRTTSRPSPKQQTALAERGFGSAGTWVPNL